MTQRYPGVGVANIEGQATYSRLQDKNHQCKKWRIGTSSIEDDLKTFCCLENGSSSIDWRFNTHGNGSFSTDGELLAPVNGSSLIHLRPRTRRPGYNSSSPIAGLWRLEMVPLKFILDLELDSLRWIVSDVCMEMVRQRSISIPINYLWWYLVNWFNTWEMVPLQLTESLGLLISFNEIKEDFFLIQIKNIWYYNVYILKLKLSINYSD